MGCRGSKHVPKDDPAPTAAKGQNDLPVLPATPADNGVNVALVVADNETLKVVITPKGEAAKATLPAAATEAATAVTETVTEVEGAAKTGVDAVGEAVKDAAVVTTEVAHGVAGQLAEEVTDLAKTATDAAKDAVGSVTTAVTDLKEAIAPSPPSPVTADINVVGDNVKLGLVTA